MKKLLWFLLVFSLQTQAKSTSKQIDELLNGLFDKNGAGGTALVVKDGKTIYRKAFGMANIELDVKMTPQHVFRIGSITKQFTAVAILQLVEAGKVDLNAEITTYIEDYPTHGHVITVKNLLNHTSGIKSYTSLAKWDHEEHKRNFTPTELIDYFKNEPMDFAPGEQFKYNNSGYILLGYIIEKVSGMNYADYIQKHIFDVLKMDQSSYGSTSRIIMNRASGYDQVEDQYRNADFLSMTQPYAAGSLLSTVDDVHTWYEAIMSDELISAESRKMAHSRGKLNDGETIDYGFGWSIGHIQGSPMIEHGGGINGFLTASLVLPEDDVFVAVFSNCLCNYPGDIANKMAAIVIDKPYDFKTIELDEATLKSYQGVYEKSAEDVRIITFDQGQLFSVRTGGTKYQIYPFAKDQFYFDDSILTLIFNRDQGGEINAVTLKGNRSDQQWMKTDKPIPVVDTIEIEPDLFSTYIGKYELNANFHINIFTEEGHNFVQATGQQKIELIATSVNQFTLKDTDIKITLNTNDLHEVVSLTLHQNGNHEAIKVE